jgi:hypothetical protein
LTGHHGHLAQTVDDSCNSQDIALLFAQKYRDLYSSVSYTVSDMMLLIARLLTVLCAMATMTRALCCLAKLPTRSIDSNPINAMAIAASLLIILNSHAMSCSFTPLACYHGSVPVDLLNWHDFSDS